MKARERQPRAIDYLINPVRSMQIRQEHERQLRYLETYRFFEQHLREVEATCFPKAEDGSSLPVIINHPGVKNTRTDLGGQRVPALRYLHDAGVSEEILAAVFKTDGTLVNVEQDKKSVWDINSPWEAAGYIASRMRPIDRIVQPSVDASLPPFGFNRHQQDHEYDVFRESQWLLQHAERYRKDITPQTYLDDSIAALCHDDGIALTRGDHSIATIVLLRHFIPGIENNPRFMEVALSIIAHDPPRVRDYLATKGALRENGTLDIGKAQRILYSDFPPAVNAIEAADRNMLGRRRVPEGELSIEAYSDKNILPQLVWTSAPYIHGTTYTNVMTFNLTIDSTERFAKLGRSSKRPQYYGRLRLHVPDHMDKRLREEQIPYSVTAEQDWFALYRKDFELQLASLAALNPHLQTFQLIMYDPNMPNDVDKGRGLKQRVHKFRRDHLTQDLDNYAQQLNNIGNSPQADSTGPTARRGINR